MPRPMTRTERRQRGGSFLPFLFSLTVFQSAALLFLVQPMVARMVLPTLGGSPSVWTTCMVFFQAVLLAGYATAHSLSRLRLRAQVPLQGILLLTPILVLPINLARFPLPSADNPIPWLLFTLGLGIGLPFFALSTIAPLLQRWFAHTRHRAANDPYFLYAASNLGSMLALLAYPFFVEPALSLVQQSWLWMSGYVLLVVFIVACAWSLLRNLAPSPRGTTKPGASEEPYDQPTPARRLTWVILAFAPSSLMLGVTTHLTTYIATIPLLWIIPLVLYLLTFILAFSQREVIPHRLVARLLPGAALLVTLLILCEDMEAPVWLVIPVHLIAFFVAALFCHQELARDRPLPAHLTEFYFWVAAGGALGGMFNALAAPLVFTWIAEYPLVLVIACIMRYRAHKQVADPLSRRLDLVLPLVLGLLTAGLVVGLQGWLEPAQLRVALMFGLPAVLCYTFIDRPVRFALGIGAMFLAGLLYVGAHGRPELSERSFFGLHRVTRDPADQYRQLIHGNTEHGRESLDPRRRGEPLSYYHRTGPIGQVFELLGPKLAGATIAVIGLGAGSLAFYARPDQDWIFYEIDPVVERIARNPSLFSFLENCPARRLDVVLGDGRLRIAEAPGESYRLIVLDAFSSDAIPVHLLTREAIRLYLDKLTPDGVLAFHISNRYLDLKPVLAALAQDARLSFRSNDDLEVSTADLTAGKKPSQWVIMAPRPENLEHLARSPRWFPFSTKPSDPVWRDDFSNILSVLKWE